MNCQIAQSNLSAYLDRELPGDAMIAVRNHLDLCPDCSCELEAIRQIKTGLGAMPLIGPREEFASNVMVAIKGSPQPAFRVPVGVVVATSVAAAVLALLAFNVFFGNQASPSYVDDSRFDPASDSAVTAPDFGGHAPLIPVNR